MSLQAEQTVVQHILDAIADQKLRAGSKLGEKELAEVFSLNRTQIRRALAMLTSFGVIDILRNKGAFITVPREEESQQVFEARRAIEAMICKNVVRLAKPADFAQLRAHIAAEDAVQAQGSRSEALRMSRRFHLILAQLGGNEVLAKYLGELTLRTSLILGCYSVRPAQLCASDEHLEIVVAMEKGDADRACALLDHHLAHLEEQVDYRAGAQAADSLSRIFELSRR